MSKKIEYQVEFYFNCLSCGTGVKANISDYSGNGNIVHGRLQKPSHCPVCDAQNPNFSVKTMTKIGYEDEIVDGVETNITERI